MSYMKDQATYVEEIGREYRERHNVPIWHGESDLDVGERLLSGRIPGSVHPDHHVNDDGSVALETEIPSFDTRTGCPEIFTFTVPVNSYWWDSWVRSAWGEELYSDDNVTVSIKGPYIVVDPGGDDGDVIIERIAK